MNPLIKCLAGYLALEYIHTINIKNKAVGYTNSIQGNKLDIGAAGIGQPILRAAYLNNGKKCDICPDLSKDIEYCKLGQQLPYNSKEFEIVFASHVLEHVTPEFVRFAIQEMSRIGNEVIIVVPHPLALTFSLVPSHKSLIYKMDNPYGIYIKNNQLHNPNHYEEYIYLNRNVFKVYQ